MVPVDGSRTGNFLKPSEFDDERIVGGGERPLGVLLRFALRCG
jgi:hypothetical protein